MAIPIGTWRTHFSYQNVNHVQVAGTKVFAAAQNGVFFWDKADQSLNVVSTVNGLSDVGVSAMDYQASSGTLLIAYQSGGVDIWAGNRIVSFPLIHDAGNEEQINHIQQDTNTAYLATSQGVRVLQISTEDTLAVAIKESYTNLSSTGDNLIIYSSALTQDSIFLATEEGIIATSLSAQVNRQDFRNWRRYGTTEGIPIQPVRFLVSLNNQIYAGLDGKGLYRYNGSSWQLTEVLTMGTFSSLQVNADQMVMIIGDSVLRYDQGKVVRLEDALLTQPQEATVDDEGNIWVGDRENGLIREQSNIYTSFYPEGPGSDHVRSLRYTNHSIIALKEVRESETGAFFVFDQGRWKNYESDRNLPVTPALLDVTYDAVSGYYYFASLGAGVLQWDGNTDFSFIGTENEGSTLLNNNITSLALQDNSELWLTNFNATAPLHRFNFPANSWQAFSFGTLASQFPLKIILADNGNPWILLNETSSVTNAGLDILVFDQQTQDHLYVKESVSSAELPGSRITDLVRDRNGQIWIGGEEGVAYFPNPWAVFSGVDVIRPIFENQFLLLGEYITALAVDGGNRKWVGTRNGLWLFDEAGENLLHHFTSRNSPLVSDVILDITVNDNDGEVFIATDKGVISYRGTATEPNVQHNLVKIFPNPVLADFEGLVGITGVAANATIKITNIAGSLVREIEAAGGTASWDVRNYQGQRVGVGIYLVFSATADGEETFVGKVAIID